MTSRTSVVGFSKPRDEAHVAVRDDADEHAVAVDDRQAARCGTVAQSASTSATVASGVVVTGFGDHARLAALDPVDHRGLVLDREVARQDCCHCKINPASPRIIVAGEAPPGSLASGYVRRLRGRPFV